jgi:D-beta-D-heptose 7-phosphate kinase / D-beta-D-heptose 1-phosphate adenosyltransferase
LAFCQAAGRGCQNSIQPANAAAGLEVDRTGVAPVDWEEIAADLSHGQGRVAAKVVSVEQMTALAKSYRRQRRRLVFTNGCFDLLHTGHATCLRAAAELGGLAGCRRQQ